MVVQFFDRADAPMHPSAIWAPSRRRGPVRRTRRWLALVLIVLDVSLVAVVILGVVYGLPWSMR